MLKQNSCCDWAPRLPYACSSLHCKRKSRNTEKLNANPFFSNREQTPKKAPTFVSMIGAFFDPRTNTKRDTDIRCGLARVSFRLHGIALLRLFGASFVLSSLHYAIAFCVARVWFRCCWIIRRCVLFSANFVSMSLNGSVAFCCSDIETNIIV